MKLVYESRLVRGTHLLIIFRMVLGAKTFWEFEVDGEHVSAHARLRDARAAMRSKADWLVKHVDPLAAS